LLSARKISYSYFEDKFYNVDNLPMVDKEKNLSKICFTGGPCAGKTTTMADLTV